MHLRRLSVIAGLCAAAGCAGPGPFAGRGGAALSSEDRREAEREHEEEGELGGPPPKGYWKIVVSPDPMWDQNQAGGGAGGGEPGGGFTDAQPTWTPVGPKPITNEFWSGNTNASGRVVSIATHPTDANTVYVGTASGGVWKTTNGGTSWSPLTDTLSTLNIGSVCLDPATPTTVYAGTGEYNVMSGGDGLFKSTNSGTTWTRVGTVAQVGANIGRVLVQPGSPTKLHVAGTSGYARSIDGGASWSYRLAGNCSDLEINPTTPTTLYVGKANDGVYKSTDGGTAPLTKLAGGLPPTAQGRIALAISKSNPLIVLAAFADSSGGLQGLYKTTDGGTIWAKLTGTPNFPSPQSDYNLAIAVDPANPNTLWAGGVFPTYAVAGVIKSINGGTSWGDVTVGSGGGQVHPDIHAFAVGPSGTVWVGTDGGVWKTTTGGVSWVNTNATLAVTQLYAISLHPADQTKITGGTQDNGSPHRVSTDAWPQIQGGDGGPSVYDFAAPSRRYFSGTNLSIWRYTTFAEDITGPWFADPSEFIAPLVGDPNNSHTLVGGTNRVWRTTTADAGANWLAISPTTVVGGWTITALAVAKGASDTIYAGGRFGGIGVTTNASSWANRSQAGVTSPVGDIVINPTNPGQAYVCYDATGGTRVARTDNFGVQWNNVTGTLPAGVQGKCLAVDWRLTPPGIWLGSGAGVYYTENQGTTWFKNGSSLPNVNIGDLQIDTATDTIVAGTYGRGAFRASLPAGTPPPPPCYANCDASTAAPILNVADFTCFLQKFTVADPWANCDNSTNIPVFNILDFTCFMQKMAAGCP